MVPQVVSNDPRPHHVHPDQPADLLLARRGCDDFSEAGDRDDIEQAGQRGKQVPVAADRTESGFRINTNVARRQVRCNFLIPLH